MANSIVQCIEVLFPQSIDKLLKEGALRSGLVPIILSPVDDRLLTKFFSG